MARRPILMLPLVLLAGAALGGDGVVDRGRIERSARFVGDVNDAIDLGVAWLLEEQEPRGGWESYPGHPAAMTALCYHTLRVCGVSADRSEMSRAWTALKSEHRHVRTKGALDTYTAALLMMAVADHGERLDVGEADSDADVRLSKADRRTMEELVEFLCRNQSTTGGWSYSRPDAVKERNRVPHFDLSNTQYALLGLKAAARCGVEVPTQTYRDALKLLLVCQEEDGPKAARRRERRPGATSERATDRARGWSYHSTRNAAAPAASATYGSMTAGSLGTVVICRSELIGREGYTAEEDARAEVSVRDGIAWLGRNFSVKRNPSATRWRGGWFYYYLYALERAGTFSAVDWMGEHDWYGEGARHLVRRQHGDGYWTEDAHPRLLTTCFALLFLRRGTVPVRRGSLAPVTGDVPIDFSRAKDVSDEDFGDLVDLALSRWRRAPDDAARERLATAARVVEKRIVLPLLHRMEDEEATRRRTAHEFLVAVTGVDLPFDPDAEAAARADQVTAFEEWYLRR